MRTALYGLDVEATRLINGLAGGNGLVDQLMIQVSAFGIPVLVLAVAALWWWGDDRRRTRHILVSAGLSFLLGLGANQIILLLIDRTRPYALGLTQLLIAPSADPSFPSDHATAAFAIAAAFLLHGMVRSGFGFLLAAFLVATSRIYVGTHYASDVLGGAATGVAAAALVSALYRRGTRVDRFVTGLL